MTTTKTRKFGWDTNTGELYDMTGVDVEAQEEGMEIEREELAPGVVEVIDRSVYGAGLEAVEIECASKGFAMEVVNWFIDKKGLGEHRKFEL